MAQSPLRPELHFESLEQILADAEALVSGPVETSGRWTAGEIIDHVRRVIHASRVGFGFRMGPLWRVLGRLMRGRAINAPMKSGFKIPASARDSFAPTPGITFEEAVEALREEVRLAAQPGAMSQPSPVFGPMAHEDWLKLHCRHAELHFGYLRRK